MQRAFVVVDLGFGDAGKGLLTDYLVRTTGAGLVVRFNGGAQAGHNVVTADGRHHTFAQFGAGTFVPGTQTFLSRDVLVHPTALLVEATALEQKQCAYVLDRLHISERARLITPFHQALNRLREMARGPRRHGSCGVGVGETVHDDLAFPDETVHASDLRAPAAVRSKLRRVQERKRAEAMALGSGWGRDAVNEFAVLEDPRLIDTWLDRIAPLRETVVVDAFLKTWAGDAVFEGAQGVLLDELHGFHPNTTWSRCTPHNALVLSHEADARDVQTFGVLRSHAIRHGAGPLPTEDDTVSPVLDHNRENLWQGRVRYGQFDAVLARYALAAAKHVDALAVTHADALRQTSNWTYCQRYRSEDGSEIEDLPVHEEPTLEQQSQLTRLLENVAPELEEMSASEAVVLERIEALLEMTIAFVSRGPRAIDAESRAQSTAAC